jgi:hypothetical protein
MKKRRIGLRDSYQTPWRVFKCCVLLLWAANVLSIRFENLQNQQALLARMATHNQKRLKKTLAFLGQELSTRNQEIILIKNDLLKQLYAS